MSLKVSARQLPPFRLPHMHLTAAVGPQYRRNGGTIGRKNTI